MDAQTGVDTQAGSDERLPLNRERVLRAAIELADAEGIDALTMRRLGQALGVEAMSLYNHVAGKDDLLGGMLEHVMREVTLPPEDAGWKAAVRECALSTYRTLQRHRWAGGLLMSPVAASETRLRWMEGVLRALRTGGFSAALACHAYHAIDSHITGFALWQASIPFTKAQLHEMGERFLTQIPVDEMPYVVEHIHQHLNETSHGGAGQFEFGLDLILDGLERLRDEG